MSWTDCTLRWQWFQYFWRMNCAERSLYQSYQVCKLFSLSDKNGKAGEYRTSFQLLELFDYLGMLSSTIAE